VTFTESGTLPTGMTFSNGTLSGTPTQAGNFPITVTPTDSNGCTGTQTYTLTISAPTIVVGRRLCSRYRWCGLRPDKLH